MGITLENAKKAAAYKVVDQFVKVTACVIRIQISIEIGTIIIPGAFLCVTCFIIYKTVNYCLSG